MAFKKLGVQLQKYVIFFLIVGSSSFLLWNYTKIHRTTKELPNTITKTENPLKQTENYPQDFLGNNIDFMILNAVRNSDPNAVLIQITQSVDITRYIFKGKEIFEIDDKDNGPNKAFETYVLPDDKMRSPLKALEPMRQWNINFSEAIKIMRENERFKNAVFATYAHLQVYPPKQPPMFALANRPLPDLKDTPFWATSAFNFKTHQEYYIYLNAITGEIAYTEEFIVKKLPE